MRRSCGFLLQIGNIVGEIGDPDAFLNERVSDGNFDEIGCLHDRIHHKDMERGKSTEQKRGRNDEHPRVAAVEQKRDECFSA